MEGSDWSAGGIILGYIYSKVEYWTNEPGQSLVCSTGRVRVWFLVLFSSKKDKYHSLSCYFLSKCGKCCPRPVFPARFFIFLLSPVFVEGRMTRVWFFIPCV